MVHHFLVARHGIGILLCQSQEFRNLAHIFGGRQWLGLNLPLSPRPPDQSLPRTPSPPPSQKQPSPPPTGSAAGCAPSTSSGPALALPTPPQGGSDGGRGKGYFKPGHYRPAWLSAAMPKCGQRYRAGSWPSGFGQTPTTRGGFAQKVSRPSASDGILQEAEGHYHFVVLKWWSLWPGARVRARWGRCLASRQPRVGWRWGWPRVRSMNSGGRCWT